MKYEYILFLLQTPGRLIPQGEAESLSCQEYVIFDPNQVKPLYLIEYTPLNFKWDSKYRTI